MNPPSESSPVTSHRTCPLCEATCGLTIEHDGRKVLRVKGDPDDVFSKGFICPKGAALGELNDDPDRLRSPMLKRDGQWVEVDWATAFEAVQAGLGAIQKSHGKNAVAVYLGNPGAHNLSGTMYNRALLKAVGTKNIFSASTVDQMPKHLSSGLMFGSPVSIPVPDVDRTEFMLMLGANPWVSNGSLATAPDWPGRLRALRRRGGRFVVVDPVRTETARHADEHVSIKPGGDAWFLAALIASVFEEGLETKGRLGEVLAGWDEVKSAVAPFTAERVAAACGVDAPTIRRIARTFAASDRAVCYGRIGTCTQRFGSLASWLVDVLNAVTGNLDEPGGAMFPMSAHEPKRPDRKPGGRGFKTGRWTSRVRGMPEVLGELPVATMADEIVSSGEDQVRGLLTVAGNPVLSTPDGATLAAALEQLDFMVCVDPYLNETTRHADVILPPPPPLSRVHYDIGFYNLAIRNVANFSPAVFDMPDDAMPEWEIVFALVGRLSGMTDSVEAVDDFVCRQAVARELQDPESPLNGRDVDEIMTALGDRRGPERLLDFMLRAGSYGDGFGGEGEGLTLDKLMSRPHGIDFGPLQARLPSNLRTPSGKVELAPALLVDDMARLDAALGEAEARPLVLIGRRHLRSNNSWMHNVPGLMTGRPRCTALVHPDDARQAGLQDGQTAQLTSDTGVVQVVVEVDERIRPGVISVPHGWGHSDGEIRMSVAASKPGVNTNLLASNRALDPLSGNAILNGIPVSLSTI